MMIYEPVILLLFLFTFQSGVNSFTIYDTQLGSSSTSPTYQGRVYVLTQRGWMQVCASSWGSSESRVLCRQLGYVYSRYGRSSSSSVYALHYSFSCSGSESSISQCSYTFSYEQQASCSYLIDVYCSPCTNGRIQIRGGVVRGAGTVEYCTSSTWKAVCDSNWDNKNAFVICRQLGYPATGAIGYQNSYFGVHPFPSSTYFTCFGNETSLSSCRSTSSSCRSDNTAGVHCRGEIITAGCINGHIRLAGGRDANEGRVEICSNGVWGTVWDGGWDSNDAKVVCRQLSLYQTHSRVEVFYNSYFGAGTGPILFTYLNCGGTESTLYGCSVYSSYYFGASHSRDAGVRCQRPATSVRSNCANGDVRLVNGSTPYEGRVEICYDGVWGSVCDQNWDYWDAAIVCRQRGYQGTNATALYNSYFGDGEGPYHVSGLNCRGDERTLLNCPRSPSSSPIGYHTCSPGNDAGVRCDTSVCGHGDVRLFGGYSDGYGVAEVCINGHWADICSRGSSSSPATIASSFCRQHTGQQSTSFGTQSCCTGIRRRNTGDKTIYSVSCTGQSGVFIQDCTYSIIPDYSAGSCNLQNEMIVGCYQSASCNAGDIRLMDGNSTLEGRVELCTQGLWGAITTSSWDLNDAKVVCRQLGLPWRWALADTSNLFGRGTRRIVGTNFGCGGTETRLSSCSYTAISLSSYTNYQSNIPAGVICQGNTLSSTECNRGDVRLVNGQSRETEGRVEVCAYGYWAIVCDNNWNIAATRLVCQQIGLPTEASEFLSGGPFGSNYQLPLVGLSCSSSVSNVSECLVNTQISYCNHQKTVGVFCKEGEYYKVEIRVSPSQESHEIGSMVTLNCTVTPSPQTHDNFIFPVIYQWYSADRGYFSSYSAGVTTIALYEQDTTDYYCLVHRGGRLLGKSRTTLSIKGVLKPSMSASSSMKIKAVQEQRITLQVSTSNLNVIDILLELTWYHNGSEILPRNDPRLILSNNNRTLTITNFTSSYAGMYKAQFDQLFVASFNEQCKDEVLSLTRHYPILKPAMFCVNMESECTDTATETRARKISVRSVNSALQGTFDNLTLEADATVFSSKELDHSSIYWYRNGIFVYYSTSGLHKNYNSLSLSQTFQQLNTFYEHSGRYEVQLKVNMYTYLQAGDSRSPCRPYYNRFVASYLRSGVILAKGFIDIGYHKGLMFDLDTDKKATTRDESATLTCRASIEFPPFSMLSFIKNGQRVATSTGGILQINTRNVNANPFGVYTCQLNASGELLHKTIQLKERVSLRMEMNTENCTKSVVEDALMLKISSDCRCNFDKSFLLNSKIVCRGSTKLTYGAVLEYSTDSGSETASTIAERIVRQVPFSMSVGGTLLTVTSAQCTDCDATKASLSSADGGGLFFGGFIVASLIAVTLVIIVVVVMKKYGLFKGKVVTRVEVKPDTVRYTTPRAPQQHQNASLNRSRAVTAPTRPRPKKPTATKPPPPPVQLRPYENMEHDGPSPIYEDV